MNKDLGLNLFQYFFWFNPDYFTLNIFWNAVNHYKSKYTIFVRIHLCDSMKISKKILIILGSIFLLLVLLDVGLNAYIKNKLPELLNSKEDAAFHISYKDADFSLLKRRISANEIKIIPTEALKNPKFKKGIYAEVK